MWEDVELRELRVFFALASELHFGRTAARLEISQSRVSQVLRDLERKIGGQLVARSSRRVSLTPLGEQFLVEARPAHDQLSRVLQQTRAANQVLAGQLRLGLLAANSAGPYLTEIIDAFERKHTDSEVVVTEVFFTDPLGALRHGEVDVLATRLPINQPDLVVGPVLASEPRVLAVADDHPLARRKTVSIDDLSDFRVAPITDFPKELIDTVFPRTIRRLARRPKTPHEVTALIARGLIVHPTVPSFAQYYGQPGITYLPIRGMPAIKSGLIWRRNSRDPRLREFIRVAREVLATHRATRRSRQAS